MLPKQEGFIRGCRTIPVARDDAVAITYPWGKSSCTDMGCGSAVIPWQCLEFVLIAVNEYWNIAKIGGKVFHSRTVDEFLALENTAEQQSDNDQHSGDHDQREARLSSRDVGVRHGEALQWFSPEGQSAKCVPWYFRRLIYDK